MTLIDYFPELQAEAEKILDEMLEEPKLKHFEWS